MAGFEVRVRAGETSNRNVLRQRTFQAGDPGRIRAGDNPANLARIVALRGARQLALPAMIPLSTKLSIMRTVVAAGLFGEVMKGCKIEGYNAGQLKAILIDPSKAENALAYVSLLDAREFAVRLSAQTGRKFRVQTEVECAMASGKLSGDNWTWTETKYGNSTFILRRLGSDARISDFPEGQNGGGAIRLVEDK